MIAGRAGGLRLTTASGAQMRPTTDRVRESVFAALGASRIEGARVLDLFAGSGALAIESLSRGAAQAVLVERDRDAVSAIVENLSSTKLVEHARVHRGDVSTFLAQASPDEGPFTLVFLDPPYELEDEQLGALLARLNVPGLLDPGATVIIERSARGSPLALPAPWRSSWSRSFGDTLVVFARIDGP